MTDYKHLIPFRPSSQGTTHDSCDRVISQLYDLLKLQESHINRITGVLKNTIKDYNWLFENCDRGQITHTDFFNVNTNALESAKAELLTSETWLNRHEIVEESLKWTIPNSNPDIL